MIKVENTKVWPPTAVVVHLDAAVLLLESGCYCMLSLHAFWQEVCGVDLFFMLKFTYTIGEQYFVCSTKTTHFSAPGHEW